MPNSDTQLISSRPYEPIYRRNFIYFLADGILFTVAIGILGTTTVIPDFVRHLTDSEILIGLSGSLFSIGFTLPQLFIARHLVRSARKKWWFVGPNIPVRFVILCFAGIIVWLGGERSGLILLAFFVCYGIAALGDGIVGVPWADLAGSSLDNRWRARVLGFTAAASGFIMLLIAPLIGRILGESGPGFPNNYALLFGISGIVFVLSIVPGLFFHELPGGKAVEKLPSFREFLPELGQVLRQDVPFRAFIVTRIFTSLFLMAAPFYIGYATVELGLSSEVAVPVLLAMQTAGGLLGALIFTWLGARNNLLYIRLALLSAALLPITALLSGVVGPIPLYIGFVVSGLSTGFNLTGSYINWIVVYASPERRPIYVGLSNTIIAIVAFMTPVIGGTIVQNYGYRLLFMTAIVMALSALFVTLRFIPNTQIEKTDGA
jgi:MFS family permease